MLLVGPNLRVVHVSTHVSLEEAIRRVTPARVLEVIELAYHSCQALGIAAPRIAVAGLNPHASENGLFGAQEAIQIQPAIEAARAAGRSPIRNRRIRSFCARPAVNTTSLSPCITTRAIFR